MKQFPLAINRIKIFLKKTYRLSRIDAKIIKYRTIRLGSPYGGWSIPQNLLNCDSICYSAGAGEDISFDLALSQKFKCKVNIFDPTPRAFEHFNKLKNNITIGLQMPINNSTSNFYCAKIEDIDRLFFFQFGIWNIDEEVKFYSPQNSQDVSHSIQNLQHTSKYFFGKVYRLSSIMKASNYNWIDLLKLDIEGCEYDVIDNIIFENIIIYCLCIEFHAEKNNYNKKNISKINEYINKLISIGYALIDIDYSFNVTLLKTNLFAKN